MPVLFRGINNNVTWSFGNSIVDILLEILLAPERVPCTYPGPGCQNPYQRSTSEDTTNNNLLKCNRHDLARLNDTLCVDILTGSRVGSTSVLSLCQALSSLNPNQIEQVWSNLCYIIQAMLSSLLSRSADCSGGYAMPSLAVTSPSETFPLPQSAPLRTRREAFNLKELACDYNNWLENEVADAVLVALCSDNQREEFVKQVCNNALLMRKLLVDEMNNWLFGYCGNSSADLGYMVSHFCVYDQWLNQPPFQDTTLLEFCMNLDGPRLTKLICEHTGFFMLLFSNPKNMKFMPNCTNVFLPPPVPDMGSPMLESCRYSEWHDLTQITSDILSQCIRLDQNGFTQEVCSNKTFLNSLLINKENAWLENHCSSSLSLPPSPKPTQPSFSITEWCDYHTWGERTVDSSVVALCWQHDQPAFHKNVCCKAPLFEKLLQDPQNKWLMSVCANMEEITVAPLVGICLN